MKKICVLILILFVFIGCSKKTITPSSPISDKIPYCYVLLFNGDNKPSKEEIVEELSFVKIIDCNLISDGKYAVIRVNPSQTGSGGLLIRKMENQEILSKIKKWNKVKLVENDLKAN